MFIDIYLFFSTALFSVLIGINAIVEPGYRDFDFELDDSTNIKWVNFTKSMYSGTSIIFTIRCDDEATNTKAVGRFHLQAVLSYHRCHQPEELVDPTGIESEFTQLTVDLLCNKSVKIDDDQLNKVTGIDMQALEKVTATKVNPTKKVKREAQKEVPTAIPKTAIALTASTKVNSSVAPIIKKQKIGENHLPFTKVKALYRLKLGFNLISAAKNNKVNFHVRIEAKYHNSYLSVINWPLLPFFGVMSLVYLAYAIGWFIASCCNWRDLLRVQFWIGGVIAIGMFENALFYSEYQSINHKGKENGLLYFAEIVSCVKRSFARILVIIVSMGFGIVKPRLGQMLHKVIAVGTVYFILASVEGCIRVRDDRLSKTQMYALIPLTVLDVGLCWWIFSSLVQTTRTLRIRKNVVKLTLYRHFTNTLIFTVVVSLAYMAWTIKQTKFTNCINIATIWLNDALWPFLFAVILAVIMVLWRPSNNNQRYAFTPLDLGDSEDDEDDMTLSDAFEGMKMRNKSENGTVPKSKKRAEDDLKWVEENIPSIPSTLLPTIDSDEEILTTKFEISKMD